MQHVGAETHRFQRAGPVVLDQHLAGVQQIQQHVAPGRGTQVDRQALLVAGVNFPMQRQSLDAPGAQRIADFRVLDLDDLGSLIGKLQAHHVAGNEAGQVHNTDTIQRRWGGRVEFNSRYHGPPWGNSLGPPIVLPDAAGAQGLDPNRRASHKLLNM
jgi:hypothetical protein